MNLYDAFEALSLQDRRNQAQVVVSGFSSLEIVCINRPRIISNEQAEKVKKAWNEHLKVRPNDFDGSTLSLKRITVGEGKKVELLCRASKYSEFMVSRKEFKIGRLEIWNFHNSIDFRYPIPVSFGMVVKTKPTKQHPNGCVIAAIRGKTTFESGKATFVPGGYIDPDEDLEGIGKKKIVNPDNPIRREYREELPGLRIWEKPPKILAIVHSLVESCQPAILGWFEIPYTAEEVAKICGNNLESEIQEIIFVPADIESLRIFAQKYTLCIHDVYKIAFFVADTM